MFMVCKVLPLLPLILLCSQAQAERHLRSTLPLNDINIGVKAVDNSHHGADGGRAGEDEAERLKRQAFRLDDININVNAVDNSRHGVGAGSNGGRPGVGSNGGQPGAGSHGGQPGSHRLKRQAPPRLDDINIKVDAVDNSRYGSGAGSHGGQPGSNRLKRHATLSDINIGVKATDNSTDGGSVGPKVPLGPGPAQPGNADGDARDDGIGGRTEQTQPGIGCGTKQAEPGIGDGAEQSHRRRRQTPVTVNNGCEEFVVPWKESKGQRTKRQAFRLDDINVNVKAVDNSRHGAGAGSNIGQAGVGSQGGQPGVTSRGGQPGTGSHSSQPGSNRLKRQAPTRLDDINIKINAVDNSRHGTGGHGGGEEAERHAPLNDINIGVNATDNSKSDSGHPIPRGPGPVVPSNPSGSDGKEEPISDGAGPDGPAIGKGAVQTESQRLKRQAPRADDINIDVNAVDNSHHGTGGHSGGEQAERLKRQAPLTRLDDINIKINAVDNSRHGGAGAGRGGGAGGGQGPPAADKGAGRLTNRS
ncbi:hypothetical protein AAVH_13126 [Aphelenchoides avenae]|nr:hypothetical protein AAVH_13126 [Aphelenchus avenae]